MVRLGEGAAGPGMAAPIGADGKRRGGAGSGGAVAGGLWGCRNLAMAFELCPGRRVGGDQPCFIIAEIGQNHQGDLDIAKRMIRMVKVRGGRRVRKSARSRPGFIPDTDCLQGDPCI